MKIVILDGYTENPGDLSWDGLKAFGDLTIYDRTGSDIQTIISRINRAEVVVTNKTPIPRSVLDACPSIRMIALLATGYNVVDVAAAREKGIPVCNVPTYGTAAVAQFAIAMLLEICHHVAAHSDAVHQGRWESSIDWCFWDYPLIELAGKTMGVIGFGRIGQQTAAIAKAMGMNIIAYDTHETDSGRALGQYVSMDELLKSADVITLHCPLFADNQGIINKATIAQMKDGVIILNNARGQLIVEADLAEALSSGKVYAAGLDVACTEPLRHDSPLLSAPNCFITPHISWAPKESRQRIMDMTIENIRAFAAGTPINVVNP